MNKRSYRLVFNARRGQVMAVAETACGHTGAAGANPGEQGRTTRALRRFALHPLSLSIGLALSLALVFSASAHAQIVADPGAPGTQRPTVLAAPNGVPLVNIQAPSAAGVSRNTYSQFDVQANGAILNNSSSNLQTQLGGWVQGNPWLGAGSARIILNEINSAHPSHLNGFVEVAGQRAEVVIANPAGIRVNGGGFINASRATLTTGTPVMNAGALESYRVQRGTISIDGAGLDTAHADYTAILARAVEVNAGIWARELNVVTGANDIHAESGQISANPEAATGTAPAFALDVAELGGMYAGKIHLVGTEAGVGVSLRGVVGATAGDVAIDTNGWLHQKGVLQASGQVRVQAQEDVRNEGEMYAQGALSVASAQALGNSGQINAQGSIHLQARDLENEAGAHVASNADVHILIDDHLANQGDIAAGGQVLMRAAALDNREGQLRGQRLDIDTQTLDNTQGGIWQTGAQALQLELGYLDNTQGRIGHAASGATPEPGQGADGGSVAGANLGDEDAVNPGAADPDPESTPSEPGAIAAPPPAPGLIRVAEQAVNEGGVMAAEGLTTLLVHDGLVNSGTVHVDRIEVHGPVLNNDGGYIDAREAWLRTDRLSNAEGRIEAHALDLEIDALDNTQGQLMAVRDLRIVASERLDNAQGLIQSTQAGVRIDAGQLGNTGGGQMHAAGDLSVQVQAGLFNDGLMAAQGDVAIAAESLDSSGVLAAGLQLNGQLAGDARLEIATAQGLRAVGHNLASGQIDLAGGAIDLRDSQSSAPNMSLHATAGDIDTRGATVVATGTLRASANGTETQKLNNAGGTISADHLQLDIAHLDNAQGTLIQSGSAATTIALRTSTQDASTGVLDNTGGTIQVNSEHFTLQAGQIVNAQGEMVHAGQGEFKVNAQTLLDNRGGLIVGNGALGVQAAQLDNSAQGRIVSGAAASIETTEALDNRGGLIAGNGALGVQAAQLDNSAQGRIVSGAAANIETTATLDNTAGLIVASGALSLQAHELANAGGQILGSADADVRAVRIDNSAAGVMHAGDDLRLQAEHLDNRGGQLLAQRDLSAHVQGAAASALLNQEGLIRVAGTTELIAERIDNRQTQGAGQGIEGRQVFISTEALDNQGGHIVADQHLAIASAGTLNNAQGSLGAGQTLSLIDPGAAEGNGSATLAIANAGGAIVADELVRVHAASLGLDGQILSQRDISLSLTGDHHLAQGVALIANRDLDLTLADGDLTNEGTLQAGERLDIQASGIHNASTGVIGAPTTRLHATGDLTNEGLIDGAVTDLHARNVTNTGNGRIYGEDVRIQAQAFLNEGNAVVAAHESLQMGIAGELINRDGATLLSLGELAVGGALDDSGAASGTAQAIYNRSAIIESLGDMRLGAEQLNNLNDQLEYRVVSAGTTSHTDYYTSAGYISSEDVGWLAPVLTTNLVEVVYWPHRISVLPKASAYADPIYREYFLGPDPLVPAHYQEVGAGESIQHQWIADSFNYSRHSPVWSVFGMEAPTWDAPGQKPGTGYQEEYAQPPSAAEIAAWEALAAPWKELHSRVSALKSTVQSQLLVADIYRTYDETSQEVVIVDGRAGRIISAQNLFLNVSGAALNQDSEIVAGGTLVISGVSVNNQATTLDAPTQRSGTLYNWVKLTEGGLWGGGDTTYGWQEAPYVESIGHTVVAPAVRYQEHAQPQTPSLQPGTHQTSHTHTSAGSAGAVAPLAPIDGTGAAPVAGAPVPDAANAAPLVSSTGGTPAVRIGAPNLALPGSSLFQLHPGSTGGYLVETDPRFTDYRQWLSSDYMLTALSIDPTMDQKRLGDGFYEQRLVREQVTQLTGQRFLGDYTSDDQQYLALMNAGVTFARAHELRPGIALSAAQVAALTSDIVWLVERTITLPDGTTTQALVPQLYVRPQVGDLLPSGSLLAGRDVNIHLSGDFTNASGTIAARQVTQITAANVHNLGGLITSGQVTAVTVQQDIHNLGGVLSAGNALVLDAGRDLNVQTTIAQGSGNTGVGNYASQSIDRVAALYVSNPNGVLLASAGRDVALTAALVQSAGDVYLQAGRDIALDTVETRTDLAAVRDSRNFVRVQQSEDIGTRIAGEGTIVLAAGQDINARAAQVQAQGSLDLKAGRDVHIEAGQQSLATDNASYVKSRSLFGSSSTEIREQRSEINAVASNLGGKQVTIRSGQDVTVQGSNVIGDMGATVQAGRDVSITAAQTHNSSERFEEHKSSGLFASGGGITLGKQEHSTDLQTQGTGAAGSTVGAINGDVNITAGRQYQQSGSDVLAPGGDVNIQAQAIQVTEARVSEAHRYEEKSRQSGLSIGIGGGVIEAAQSITQTLEAVGETKDTRMKALGIAAAGLKAAGTIGSVQDALAKGKSPTEAAGVSLNISIGSSKSQSVSQSQSDNAQGSTIQASGDVNLKASGAGQDSDILIQGSQVSAGNTARLSAEGDIELLASQNTTEQSHQSSGKSGSIGVDMQLGGKGVDIGVNIAASKGKGQGAGDETAYTNTHIEAGERVQIESGGDTALRGAVVAANTVTTNVGGNLTIESLQDTSTYQESSRQAGGSLTIGPSSGGSISVGQTKIDSDYQSVNEQSGIRAGDGGFQVQVQGHTKLIGGAITSTQAAVDQGLNQFSSDGGVSTSDIYNRADYSAAGSGVTLGVRSQLGNSGIGIGSDNGSASSVTQAAISGIGGNTEARTGDAEMGIAPIFDQEQVRKEVNAQVTATKAFTQQAVPLAASYADDKAVALRKEGNEEEARKWDEAGEHRVALHAAIGLLTGGVAGAVGAATGAALIPQIGEEIAVLNLPEPVRQAATQVAGAMLGAATGGMAGAAASLGQTAHNYVSHSPFASVRRAVSQENARLMNECGMNCTAEDFQRIDQQMAALERAGSLAAVNQTSKLTTEQALQLGELLVSLHPLYGTPIALYQAISGQGIATQTELNAAERFFNGAAAAIPLGSAAYKVVTNAAQDMAKMASSIGAIHHFKSADEINSVMNAFNKAPAWKEGTQVAEVTLKPGTQVQMVVDKAAFEAIERGEMNFVGNWASFDNIPNQVFARNNLAITNEFKKDVGYIVELEVVKPVNAQIGVVGSQGTASGGANQLNFLFEQRNGGEFFKLTSSRELP